MLVLKDITKSYKPKNCVEVEALRGVSYEFPEKGLVFVVGKSGSGKSTMLNILGLLDNYDGGDLIIDGKSSKEFTANERDSWRAINIGFVFQDFHIIENYNIGKNISLPLEISKRPVSDEQINSALKKVGLEGFEKRNSAEISGGQRQRVAIARALIKNPRIILADEPTGSLDTENGAALFNLLKELGKEKLIIVISHDIDSANKYADRIIELADGKIVNTYEGEGVREVVKIESDKIDQTQISEINLLLASNKKVLIAGSAPQNEIKMQENTASDIYEYDKKPGLPIKNAVHLSLLNIRKKWLRTFWMVLITMFAVAFFGFSDVVGRFDITNIMAEEIQKTNIPFMNITSYKMDESSFWEDRSQRTMTEELMGAFENIGLEHIKKYKFTSGKFVPMHLAHQAFFPGQGTPNYYSNTVNGVIEIDDLSKIGLQLSAGRMPQNLNEVVITNYQLEKYKLFGLNIANEMGEVQEYLYGTHTQNISGLNKDIPYNPLKTFDDIYEKPVTLNWQTELHKFFCYKIVGVIDFDLSMFDEVAAIKTVQSKITQEQRRILRDAEYAKAAYLDNFFVLPGFNEEFTKMYPSLHLSNFDFQLSLPDGAGLKKTEANPSYRNPVTYPLTADGIKFNEDNEAPSVIMNPAITHKDIASKNPADSSYNKKQCVISYHLLWDLLDVDTRAAYTEKQKEYYEIYKDYPRPEGENIYWNQAHAWTLTFKDIIADLNVFGGVITVSMNTTVYGTEIIADNEEYKIVGILNQYIGNRLSSSSNDRIFIPTNVFYKDAYVRVSDSFIVPIASRNQILSVLNRLETDGRYVSSVLDENGEPEVYRFMVTTARAGEIYSLDVLFKLFVNVFRVLSLVLCVFAILVCYNFISNSISSRKKDIGILRSMGASGSDIARIFTIEGVFIAVLVIIFGILTCSLGYFLMNKYFILKIGYLAEEYALVSFGLRQILLMTALTVGAVAISIAAPIIRIAKKQPVDVIRN